MIKLKIRGKLSIVWLIALAVILYTGIQLVCEAKQQANNSTEVFANGGTYNKPNAAIMDLFG